MKRNSFILFLIISCICIFGINSYSKTILVNLSNKIQTNSEPILVKGKIVDSTDNKCFIKVLSETYGGDVLQANHKCPNSLKKGKVVFGLFDGKSFVFLRNRR